MATDNDFKARLRWVMMLEDTGDAGLTCRRCGVSLPTLRKWWRRYVAEGEAGLRSRSKRRIHPPPEKASAEHEKAILALREKRTVGPKSLQSILEREQNLRLSTSTLWQVLHENNVSSLRKPRVPDPPTRYSRPIPGERVQLDTCQIGKGLYQFTAVDDCTRLRVLAVYQRRTAANALDFLEEHLLEEMPFPIQTIQTDRGSEFMGVAFQMALRRHCIRYRPIRPRSPHLNGKVERSQQTDRIEFWASADVVGTDIAEIEGQLAEWQHYYNWQRPHTALAGKTPMDRYFELMHDTPWSWEVTDRYDWKNERLRTRDYVLDQQEARLATGGTIASPEAGEH